MVSPAHHDMVPLRTKNATRSLVPAAMVGRREGRLLYRQGSERAGAGIRLFRGEPGRRTAANLLTRDEARRIAVNIAKAARIL
jgi:hypothetical protein